MEGQAHRKEGRVEDQWQCEGRSRSHTRTVVAEYGQLDIQALWEGEDTKRGQKNGSSHYKK